MKDSLSVTLLHTLPGRIRIRLSDLPFDNSRFIEAILSHGGVEKVSFSKISKSLLIKYGELTPEAAQLFVKTTDGYKHPNKMYAMLTVRRPHMSGWRVN